MRSSLRIAGIVTATIFAPAFSSHAEAQGMQCQLYATREQRVACYQRQAATAPGPSCLFCAPPVQQPAQRTKRRARR